MSHKRSSTIRRKISLDIHAIALAEEIFFDPLRGKPLYGAIGGLVSDLLRQWLRANRIHTLDEARRYRESLNGYAKLGAEPAPDPETEDQEL